MVSLNRRILKSPHKPAANRWTEWAASLAERYGRIVLRRPGPAMQLFHPGDPGMRWLNWSIHPQIYLSVYPVRERNGLTAKDMPGGMQSMFMSRTRDFAAQAPVPKLFARAAHSELEGPVRERQRVPEGFSRSLEDPAQEKQLVQRLFQQRQRVEQRPSDPPAALDIHTAATVASRIVAPMTPARKPNRKGDIAFEAEEIFEPRGWSGQAPKTPQARAVPELDIERLTEQVVRKIDERIIAHRERLGKNF